MNISPPLPPADQIEFSLGDTLKDSRQHLGVLLLLPQSLTASSIQPVSQLKLTHPPVDVLYKLAKVGGKLFFTVKSPYKEHAYNELWL